MILFSVRECRCPALRVTVVSTKLPQEQGPALTVQLAHTAPTPPSVSKTIMVSAWFLQFIYMIFSRWFVFSKKKFAGLGYKIRISSQMCRSVYVHVTWAFLCRLQFFFFFFFFIWCHIKLKYSCLFCLLLTQLYIHEYNYSNTGWSVLQSSLVCRLQCFFLSLVSHKT